MPMNDSKMTECRTCLGRGDILVGWTDGTWMSPPDPITDECPVCWGQGVLPEEELLDYFGGEFPEEWEAREMRAKRIEAARDEAEESK